LKIKAYKNSQVARAEDQELKILSKYLVKISAVDDLTALDHSGWRNIEKD